MTYLFFFLGGGVGGGGGGVPEILTISLHSRRLDLENLFIYQE